MCTGKLKKNVLIKENVSLRLISEKKTNITGLYMNALFKYLKIYKSKQFKNLLYFVYKKTNTTGSNILLYVFPQK